MKKPCNVCGEFKELTEFYKAKGCTYGVRGDCKKCFNSSASKWQKDNPEKVRGYKKTWTDNNPETVRSYRLANKDRQKKLHKTWRDKNPDKISKNAKKLLAKWPEKLHARWAVNNAIQDGRLIKQPCEVCGNPKAQAHHDDYSKPLEVRWLCQKHHTEHHARAKYVEQHN